MSDDAKSQCFQYTTWEYWAVECHSGRHREDGPAYTAYREDKMDSYQEWWWHGQRVYRSVARKPCPSGRG